MREMVVDLRRLVRQKEETPAPAIAHPRGWKRTAAALTGIVAILAAVGGIWLWIRSGGGPAPRSEWVQLTNFPDSVSQPALSPDGRMLTFIRGPGSFRTAGQIYVKILPDGEPKQLTNDNLEKMSPVFPPDGSRIAYTAFYWDTWVAPVLGGEPRLWLPNASGLVWRDKNNILFSEIFDRLEGNHMKIVAAEESRAGARDVYIPAAKGAMAHRSFPSPDGRWVLLAEMTDRGVWIPCRLIPLDGSSPGRQIGPPGAACWFAAWSPDGKWMYINSGAGVIFHIWRQLTAALHLAQYQTSKATARCSVQQVRLSFAPGKENMGPRTAYARTAAGCGRRSSIPSLKHGAYPAMANRCWFTRATRQPAESQQPPQRSMKILLPERVCRR